MSLHTLLYWSMIGICSCIAIIGLTVIGCVFYVLVNMGIDWYQQTHRRPMASAMPRNEILAKRLERSVKARRDTIRLANRGFTIIELIIVLAIIGSLSWVAITSMDRAAKAKAQFMAQCHYPKPACEDMWKNNK